MPFYKTLFMTAASVSLLAGPACAESHMEAETSTVTGSAGTTVTLEKLATFDSAWAMTFLPDGRSLVTEKTGEIWLIGTDGQKLGQISGAPSVSPRNQGGLGDIILHPDFESTGQVYISYVERDPQDDQFSGAVVALATLSLGDDSGTLSGMEIIWRQAPKMTGNGHYGHRMVISPDGQYLFITSGERQHFTPAQNMDMNLGKVVRLNLDGSVPTDNPFYGQGGVTDEIWTLGHRNPLGVDFAADGTLWVHEMGPAHGDELNKIVRGENYGYPVVSNGDHYSGTEIPDHSDIPIYSEPAVWWDPAISPAGFDIYYGSQFSDWQGDGFIGGLSSKALIRVDFDAEGGPAEAERFEWGMRIREVEEGPDGAIYVLEDGREGPGRLVRMTPGG